MTAETVAQPKYVDDLTCRETYAETVQVLFDSAGLLRIELCVRRWTAYAPITQDRAVPVARLAMPVGLGMALRDQLTKAIEHAERTMKLAQAPAASDTKQ